MIVCSLATYFFREESTPTWATPHNHVAVVDVSLDVFTGDDGDLYIRPVVDLLEWTSDPSPRLVETLSMSCRRDYSRVNSYENIRLTRFLFDGHPTMLVGLVSGIKTPTRRIRFSNPITNLDEALQAIGDGMMVAPHQLMLLKSLLQPSGEDAPRRSQHYHEPVAYWTCMAIKLTRSDDFGIFDPVSVTHHFENVESLYAAALHLVDHSQLRRTWKTAVSSTGDSP